MITTIFSILETRSTKPKHPNFNKHEPNHIRTLYYSNHKKITHKSRKQNHNHEIWSEKEKAHTFSLKIWGWNDVKMEVFQEWYGEFERGKNGEDNEQLEMFEGKLKSFKKLSLKCKTRDFCDWIKSWASRQGQLLEHLKTKIWNIF